MVIIIMPVNSICCHSYNCLNCHVNAPVHGYRTLPRLYPSDTRHDPLPDTLSTSGSAYIHTYMDIDDVVVIGTAMQV